MYGPKHVYGLCAHVYTRVNICGCMNILLADMVMYINFSAGDISIPACYMAQHKNW